MPRCSECCYEGVYAMKPSAVDRITGGGYMKCQAPGGGPTQNEISIREAATDQPCSFFQQKVKAERTKKRSLLSTIFGIFSANKQEENVKLKEKMVKEGCTYEVYTANNENEAISFLRKRPVTKRLYYIVVETPVGNWGMDTDGIFREK